MSNVVNLAKFRKKKDRERRAREAEHNRTRHGRTKSERETDRAVREQVDAALDGLKREPAPKPTASAEPPIDMPTDAPAKPPATPSNDD